MGKVNNSYELKLISESGKIAGSVLKKGIDAIAIGVSEIEIDKLCEKEIYKLGGDLSYKTVPGYKFATCITVNDQVVHGLPTQRKFQDGDLVSIDLAVEYKGWHSDCAWSILVKEKGKKKKEKELIEKESFLKVGEEALWDAIEKATEGSRVGDISSLIQSKIEGAGYHVVRSLVGHGIGKNLHEEPEIPGYGEAGTGPVLKSGMALAIEVIYTKGTADVKLDKDSWTYLSADGSWGAVFEMTVIVGKKQAQVLTVVK
jgi:methionyl aminopeptidase